MPSEGLRLPGQYLLSQLGSGVRPFPYRSGVYRLLGLPLPAEKRIGFRPPLPPVGFQYLQPRWGEEPSPAAPADAPPPPRPRSSPADEVVFEAEAPHRASSPQVSGERSLVRRAAGGPDDTVGEFVSAGRAPPPPAPPPMLGEGRTASAGQPTWGERRDPFNLPPALGGGGEPKRAGGGRTSGASSDRQTTHPDQPPLARARTTGLAIPGITERRLVFAALAGQLPLQDAPVAPEQASPRPATANVPRPPPAPAGSGERVAAPAAAVSAPTPERVEPRHSPARRRGGAPEGVDALAGPAGPARVSVRQAAGRTPEDAQPGALLRSRPRVAEQIEQLRTAVARLAARSEPPQVEAVEAPPAPPSAFSVPVTREVVVIRSAPRSSRGIPRSFWASSTLRSIHLGVLR